jgi:hypothetical protein
MTSPNLRRSVAPCCLLLQHGRVGHHVHAAAFTGANVRASAIFSVALTLPVRPSSNFTWVSMYCSDLAAVQRVDQHLVLLADVAAPDLVGAGELAVVGIQFLVQHQEAADLRAGQLVVGGQVGVDLLDAVLDQGVDLGLLRQVGVAGVRQVAPLGPVAHRVEVDVDHHADLVALVAQRHHFLDVAGRT